ncbi:MAG: sulfite exporter TauE/SafE family protein [Planctomycetota bacterium]|jgi:uncharacterized membrane protein YfcA
MTPTEIIALAAVMAVIAVVYSMVGLGGGSGYLMVMGVAGLAPEVMKPTALMLNVVVATTGLVRFSRVGGFRWRALWPFVITSVPFAFLGGAINLDPVFYRRLVAVVLLFAAYRLAFKLPARADAETVRKVPLSTALIWGAAIGIVSGLVGIGGGILLGPVLLLFGWATARQTAGIMAAFILINSAAALVGFAARHQGIPVEPEAVMAFAAAVFIGGLIGTGIGTRRLGHVGMRRVLAAILLFAGVKMMFFPGGTAPSEAPPAVEVGRGPDGVRYWT